MKPTFYFALLLLLAACSKDKVASRRLQGNWKLVKKEVSGVEQDLTGLSFVFEFGDCISANKGCRGVYRKKIPLPNNSSETEVLPIETIFSNNGQTLTIDYDYGSEIEVYDVIELTKKKIILRFQGSENQYYFDPI